MSNTQTVNVPAWYANVPQKITLLPEYFRRVWEKFDDFELELTPITSSFAKHSIKVIYKSQKKTKGKEKNYAVRWISPPLRLKYTHLSGTGDFGKIPNCKDPVTKANFSATPYEGNIPDDIKQIWPGLEAEQKAYFDFLQDYNKKVLKMMWDHPDVRIDAKRRLRQDALRMWNLPGTDVEKDKAMDSPENQEKLQQLFFEGANRDSEGGEAPFVKNVPGSQQNNRIQGRYQGLKRPICYDLDEKKKPNPVALGWPKNPHHYINVLYSEKKVYTPATILDEYGTKILPVFKEDPTKEKETIGQEDMAMIVATGPPFDCKAQYGIKAKLEVLQRMRSALPEEVRDGRGEDLSSCAIIHSVHAVKNRPSLADYAGSDDEDDVRQHEIANFTDPPANLAAALGKRPAEGQIQQENEAKVSKTE